MLISFFYLDTKEQKSWLAAFLALSLSFLPLLFHFVWGNHDWSPLINDSKITHGLIEGRFAQYLFPTIFLEGKILPVINLLLGFALYCYSLIILCTRFFNFNLSQKSDIVFIMAISTLPYINELIYFYFITFSQLSWPLVITLALIAAKKATQSHFLLFTLLSTALMFIAIGGYPASSSLFATAASLYALKVLTASQNCKTLFLKTLPFAISLSLSLAPFPILYSWFQKKGLMTPLYNSETENLSNLITKIPDIISQSIQSLLQPLPFFPLYFKTIILLITIIFFFFQYRTSKNLSTKILNLLLFFILLWSLKLPLWLISSKTNHFFAQYDPLGNMIRQDFYAIPTLLLFALFITNTTTKLWLKNLLYTLTILLLFLNINLNLSFSKTHILGFKAENNLLDRQINRINEHPNFTPNRYYAIIQKGEIPLRSKYYQPAPNEKYGYYVLRAPYIRYWHAKDYFNFYAPQNFITAKTEINIEDISEDMSNYIENKITPWPSENALFIDNKYIIITLTPTEQKAFKEQYNQIKEYIR